MDGTTSHAATLAATIDLPVCVVTATGIEHHGTIAGLVIAMLNRGVEMSGYATRKSLRAELRGLPTFAGLVGPCWGGDHVRYETQAVHAAVSL